MAPASGNPADRRPAPRLGWRFSLFTAVCAGLVAAWIDRLKPLSEQLAEDVPLVVLAFAAARVAGWLAVWTGGRDHGFRAGAFTWVIFSFGVTATFANAAAWLADPLTQLEHVPMGAMIVGAVALVPCVVGSLLFQGGVLVSARLTARRGQPTGSG
jgi:hypothetical protein